MRLSKKSERQSIFREPSLMSMSSRSVMLCRESMIWEMSNVTRLADFILWSMFFFNLKHFPDFYVHDVMQNDKWSLQKFMKQQIYHTPPHFAPLCIQKGQKNILKDKHNFSNIKEITPKSSLKHLNLLFKLLK